MSNMLEMMKKQKEIKEKYKKGMKVKLIFMDDPQAPAPGTNGEIQFVDDMGNIHVKWETGSSLSLIEGEDKFMLI